MTQHIGRVLILPESQAQDTIVKDLRCNDFGNNPFYICENNDEGIKAHVKYLANMFPQYKVWYICPIASAAVVQEIESTLYILSKVDDDFIPSETFKA